MTERKKGSAAVMLVLIAYLLLPLIVTIVYSLFDKWTEIVPHGFSVKRLCGTVSGSGVFAVYSQKSDRMCGTNCADHSDHPSGNVCNQFVLSEA